MLSARAAGPVPVGGGRSIGIRGGALRAADLVEVDFAPSPVRVTKAKMASARARRERAVGGRRMM